MLASTLISEIKFKVVSPKDYDDFEVSSLVSDTRKVEENSIFVAIKGYTVDGHEFISEAIRKGAKAIVVQEETDDIQGVTIVRVNNT
ncbi:Mur ligase domain-containing protein, partial [Ligilactobacillus ruminis]